MIKTIKKISAIMIAIFIAAPVYASPEIHFIQPFTNVAKNEIIIDIGKIKKSSYADCDILFTNRGTSNLKIDFEACCGREVKLITGENTAPGKNGKIKFYFNTRNRTGVIMDSFVMLTNQPGREKITVYVKVEILP